MSIVEAQDGLLKLNGPLCFANIIMLLSLMERKGIFIYTGFKAIRTTEQGVLIETGAGEAELNADSVVLAVGYDSQNRLHNELKYEVRDLYILGDARKVSNIMYAICDAFEVASNIKKIKMSSHRASSQYGDLPGGNSFFIAIGLVPYHFL